MTALMVNRMSCLGSFNYFVYNFVLKSSQFYIFYKIIYFLQEHTEIKIGPIDRHFYFK